jgi:hypothetical protein
MGKLKYLNGQRTAGAPTNTFRPQGVKRGATGAVSLTNAPTTKKTYTGGAATKMTKSPTLGLTGGAGGRNFFKGKFSGINTNATKKVTLTASIKTAAAAFVKLGTAKGTHTATASLSNTKGYALGVPGTLKVKAKGTAGKIGSIKVSALKVNALTTLMW